MSMDSKRLTGMGTREWERETGIEKSRSRRTLLEREKQKRHLQIVHRDFCATAYVSIRKWENIRKIVYCIWVVSDYNITI